METKTSWLRWATDMQKARISREEIIGRSNFGRYRHGVKTYDVYFSCFLPLLPRTLLFYWSLHLWFALFSASLVSLAKF